MNDPKDIKIVNTDQFAMAIDRFAHQLGLKPATVAGAAMSVYVSTMIDLAEAEGDVAMVHRNLDRAIEMLTVMRQADTPAAMEQNALELTHRHNAAVHEADAKRRAEEKPKPPFPPDLKTEQTH